jgi:hypothetical protein
VLPNPDNSCAYDTLWARTLLDRRFDLNNGLRRLVHGTILSPRPVSILRRTQEAHLSKIAHST